jgi:hypothetical protein
VTLYQTRIEGTDQVDSVAARVNLGFHKEASTRLEDGRSSASAGVTG